MKSYQEFFEEPPPADIWPKPTIRFGKDLHHQRINLRDHWIIRKSPKTRMLAVLLTLAALAGITKKPFSNDSPLIAGLDPTLVGVVVAIGFILFVVLGVYLRNKCPKCKKIQAIEPTGEKKRGSFLRAGKAEWKCQFCGFMAWYPIYYLSGGCSAGGCGSDGECGSGGCGS